MIRIKNSSQKAALNAVVKSQKAGKAWKEIVIH